MCRYGHLFGIFSPFGGLVYLDMPIYEYDISGMNYLTQVGPQYKTGYDCVHVGLLVVFTHTHFMSKQ